MGEELLPRGRTKAVSDHLIPVCLRLSWPWHASPESQGTPRSRESQNGWFPCGITPRPLNQCVVGPQRALWAGVPGD